MSQMSLLDALHAPVTTLPVEPNGTVIPVGEVDEILRLPMRRQKGDQACIELHRDRARNLWMWATWHEIEHGGGGRRVGPGACLVQSRLAAVSNALCYANAVSTRPSGSRIHSNQTRHKWGRFTATRADALHCATTELLDRLAGYDTPQARRIRIWLENLR